MSMYSVQYCLLDHYILFHTPYKKCSITSSVRYIQLYALFMTHREYCSLGRYLGFHVFGGWCLLFVCSYIQTIIENSHSKYSNMQNKANFFGLHMVMALYSSVDYTSSQIHTVQICILSSLFPLFPSSLFIAWSNSQSFT